MDTMALHHHDGCVGYRIQFAGKTACMIFDTTHVPDFPDKRLHEFVDGADLMVFDGTYTDDEFPQFANFGHSTWEEGIRICQTAGVKEYCIFHHRPSRTDEDLDAIELAARQVFPRSHVAREGLIIEL